MKYAYLLLLALTPSISNAYSTYGTKWGDPTFGTGAAITYSFMSSDVGNNQRCESDSSGTPTPCSALSSFMPAGYKDEIERAFDAWASVADLTFTEVDDDGATWNHPTDSGDIRFSGHAMDGSYNTLAHAYSPPPNGNSAAGDIHFDTAEKWTIDTSGFSIFWVALHEIGHAIGLGHSEAGNIMGRFYNPALTGLQEDDIAGARAIYGAAKQRVSPVPVPTAAWLFAPAMLGLFVTRRKLAKTAQA